MVGKLNVIYHNIIKFAQNNFILYKRCQPNSVQSGDRHDIVHGWMYDDRYLLESWNKQDNSNAPRYLCISNQGIGVARGTANSLHVDCISDHWSGRFCVGNGRDNDER